MNQILPGLYKRFGAVVLKLGGQSIDIDATLGELPECNVARAIICGETSVDLSMISKSLQSFFGHGIYREGNCQSFDVQDVRCSRVFGAGAGPQQTLRPSPEIVNAPRALVVEQRVVRTVDTPRNRDAQPVTKHIGHVVHDGYIPSTDENRGNRRNIWIQASINATLDASQVGFSGREIVLL